MPAGHSNRPTADEGFRLEPATPGDARALAEMSRLLIERGLGWRWGTAAIAREIRDEDAIVLVARAGRDRIGFAAMRFDFDRRAAHLLLLAVAPQHRRRGAARALCAWLEEVARRGGIRKVALEVRETATAARAFYRRAGFRLVERIPGYYQRREDALRLVKTLDSSHFEP